MKYEKAQDILPNYIVEIIQQYIDGGYLYIPRKCENRKAWGENNGVKDDLMNRNREIYNSFQKGTSIKSLAEKYYLVEHTIRKIIREVKKTK
ncbi:CD3324 family protein [Clostridium lamae]|uniref:CD3324 family protein n=1 Tax=Clostridium TaxID=1485 RepID=UPI00374E4B07